MNKQKNGSHQRRVLGTTKAPKYPTFAQRLNWSLFAERQEQVRDDEWKMAFLIRLALFWGGLTAFSPTSFLTNLGITVGVGLYGLLTRAGRPVVVVRWE